MYWSHQWTPELQSVFHTCQVRVVPSLAPVIFTCGCGWVVENPFESFWYFSFARNFPTVPPWYGSSISSTTPQLHQAGFFSDEAKVPTLVLGGFWQDLVESFDEGATLWGAGVGKWGVWLRESRHAHSSLLTRGPLDHVLHCQIQSHHISWHLIASHHIWPKISRFFCQAVLMVSSSMPIHCPLAKLPGMVRLGHSSV